jgi:hypothetical protein
VIDSLTYLAEIYWPYMLGVLVIGLASGWFSYSARNK